ncbi:prepilin peptidase [Petrocella sp. FN5]|uniref:prepilin peptidase n=1 Tax=Petrocella sp. FN5 TaxID=3032002 RepID=UPI0023DA2F85|nr:prepilin peptidase [Petrocella sp. FN5]MDF1618374.1 hypothetical protein [Petrocella sp. FN5]
MEYLGALIIGGMTGNYLSNGGKINKIKTLWILCAVVISMGVHSICVYQFTDKTSYLIFYLTSVLLLTIGYKDYRELLVPMDLIIVGGVLGLYLNMTLPALGGWINLVSALVTLLLLGALSRISRGGFGEGDAYVMALIGLFYGGMYVLILGMMALIMSGVFSLICLIFGKANRKTLLPFVPFIAAAHLFLIWV